jgi:Domain of unknown function (DUF4336)
MLERVGDDLWIAEGPSVSFFGIPYPTRAAIVRLDGRVWIWSPIALSDDLARAVEALGEVRYLIAPNKLHHLFLAAWKTRWPSARLYAAPGLARRRRDLRFDAELGDVPEPEWAPAIEQAVVRGSFAMEEVVFFHRPSRTVLVTDLVQKFDPATLKPWQRLVMGLDGMLGPGGSTPREWRLSFWNRRAARAALRRVLAWDAERLVIAHGVWVRTNGTAALRTSLGWLKP